jgi:hypothetical protein
MKLLGAAGLTVLAAPRAAEAKKKNCKKKVNQKCASQLAGCQTEVLDFCDGNQNCEENLFDCCESLASCDAEGALTCIISSVV